MDKPTLKIIPIGGTTTVQKNMYVYESGNDIIVFDCGIGFPDMETPGVDVIIPDFTYILENRDRVRGIIITHGHEDHRGSLPYLLEKYAFDVYAVPFVKGLIEKSLEEYTNLNHIKIKSFDPDRSMQLGVFKINAFHVNHSVPDTLGFAIDTPQGRVFHCADYKFDWTPVMDRPFDVRKAAVLASEPKEGILAMLSDCLGSTSEGYARSEKTIQATFEKILENSANSQVFITTISSNISRIQQAIDASIKFKRKVVLSGRSINNTMSVAREMKYINSPENIFVEERNAHKYPQRELTYIISGSYGQKGSGLWRVAMGEHKSTTLEKNAVVIFSADPIPNSVSAVNFMIDELYMKGAEIYYSEIQNNLHVSGHGGKGDLSLLANIVKPKFFIPIGGNVKHMRAYSDMMEAQGVDPKRVLQLLDGQSVIFENSTVRLGERLKLKEVYVDGSLVGDVGTKILEDRIQMANHGMAVIVIKGGKAELYTRGFVFVKESKKLITDATLFVEKKYGEFAKQKQNPQEIQTKIEAAIEKYFFNKTKRKPLVLVSISP